MALANTVCMSLAEYYQYSTATVLLSMGVGVFIGWITMRRWDLKKYSSRQFTEGLSPPRT